MTYTEAIEILQKAVEEGVEFEEKPVWGIDLPSEHERYICEKVFQQPVVLTDYPKEIKAFCMKLNDDGRPQPMSWCQRLERSLVDHSGSIV